MRNIFEIASEWKDSIQLARYRRHIRDLINRGLELGNNVTIGPTAWIDYDYCYLIRIGDNSAISKGVRLIAHDATTFNYVDRHTRIGKIDIKENCYLGENVIVLPGVTIGPNVLVAAGSVVNKDIPPNSCIAGVPARFYAKFDDFVEKQRQAIAEATVFDYPYLSTHLNDDMKQKVMAAVQEKDAYVKGYGGRFPWIWNGNA